MEKERATFRFVVFDSFTWDYTSFRNCDTLNYSYNTIMKGETTVDRMLADDINLVLKTQWTVSDELGIKEQAE